MIAHEGSLTTALLKTSIRPLSKTLGARFPLTVHVQADVHSALAARELAPARLRSSRKTGWSDVPGRTASVHFGAAAQPSGSKLPRHRGLW
nr:hypothetical protein C1892_23935 [Pseudomonas sp. MPBD7-1]